VNVGGYQGVRAHPGLRAAVNAQLEEISFRTGLISAAIALVALLAIAAAGVYAATVSQATPVSPAAGVRSGASAAGMPSAATAPAVAAQPSAPARPTASPKPKAQPTVPAAGTSPQAGVAPQPQTPAGSSGQVSPQVRPQGDWHASRHGYRPWSGTHVPKHGGFGFPGP